MAMQKMRTSSQKESSKRYKSCYTKTQVKKKHFSTFTGAKAMLATEIRVTALKTARECWKAIDLIEPDPRNFQGSVKSWNEGKQCFLKPAAEKVVDRLNARAEKLSASED